MLIILASNRSESSGSNHHPPQQFQDLTTAIPSNELCGMISDGTMDRNSYGKFPKQKSLTVNTKDGEIARNNADKIGTEQNCIVSDKVKTNSWDNHDSMHTTTRTGKVIDEDFRRWNSMDSIHSIKAATNKSMSISSNEKEMQGSNSDYNDSICSFASFGEASFSDNMDTSGNHSSSNNGTMDAYTNKASIHFASMAFTRSFDCEQQNQRHLMKSVSYRGLFNGGNSLSKIQETNLD
jgi:hypothetical protein